jgi:hypothetical protein
LECYSKPLSQNDVAPGLVRDDSAVLGAIFIHAFPRECTEKFLEGHRRAAEFFDGVPRRISYDNSAIAVMEVLRGRERKLTKEALRLQSHDLFQKHFCLVRPPSENGYVERLPKANGCGSSASRNSSRSCSAKGRR